MDRQIAEKLVAAIHADRWNGGIYETAEGRKIVGATVGDARKALIEAGFRNVSRLDDRDFRSMGFEIVTARYIGGARPKRFCPVLVKREYRGETGFATEVAAREWAESQSLGYPWEVVEREDRFFVRIEYREPYGC